MKTIKRISTPLKMSVLFTLLFLIFSSGYAQIDKDKRSELIKPETSISEDMIWHVKAFRPDAQILQVKAIAKNGKVYDVKAIQPFETSSSVLSVKALINDKQIPIKIILPQDDSKYFPLVAIKDNGSLLKIVAISDAGEYLEVKGHSKSGNIIHISAITKDALGYNIIALSPFGEVNAVMGMKMLNVTEEAVINGVSIFAHVKAIKQN